MGYVFKHISVSDVPVLKALLAVFGEAFGEPETYQGAVPSDTYLESLLAKPHFIAVAAVSGEDVVGGLAAYDLAVREDHRRKGVATGLIRELGRIAKSRGAYVMFVQADPEDAPAIRLYESLGTREDVHHFDIPTGK
jgi:aminoglycoside 3-N-acetyltransferase I